MCINMFIHVYIYRHYPWSETKYDLYLYTFIVDEFIPPPVTRAKTVQCHTFINTQFYVDIHIFSNPL
jgi:hypothetical protein